MKSTLLFKSFQGFIVTALVALFIILLNPGKGNAQTPGLIVKPALAPGNSVLDPDGDGYVSQKTNGVQLGFTIPPENDVTQSEIPYVAIIRPDPTGDILRGPVGGFIEIVGVDAAGNNAILVYSDGTNFMFRFRMGGYAPNSKSYSLLIDADSKFGFTGINADPNAITGNPGFEAEIVLETNFNVKAFNVDGTTTAIEVTRASYDTNCQKAMAVSVAGGDPDYFYDFYLPYSSISSLYTSSTALRIVAVTVMNPNGATGNNALSDIGGATTGSSSDAIFEDLIDAQTPTVPGTEVLDRSNCPTINLVNSAATAITGTSTEAPGTTITVYVYQSNGVSLIGSGTTTTTGSLPTTNWSIDENALSGPVTLADGQIVKATATAIGEGTSYNNCSIKTVSSCTVLTPVPTDPEIGRVSGDKGFEITLGVDRPIGTKVYLYTSDYSLRTVSDLQDGVTNPILTTASPQTIKFACQTGNCFGAEVYYFRYEEPGECISSYYVACDYASGASATPVISTPTITTSTTSISGTGTAASSQIILYADGNQIASATSGASSPFSWTATVSGLTVCQLITARQIAGAACLSPASTGITVTRIANRPVITTSGCAVTAPGTISGTSSEIGATVTLYKTSPTAATLGTATVLANGTWSVGSLTLSSGAVLVAAVTSGSCLTTGVNSDPVTISTQTDISGYTIAITDPLETATTVAGSISGGVTYPVTLNVYIDQTLAGTGVSVSAAGAWSVSVAAGDLYIGGIVQVTLTAAGNCESALSSATATVQCDPPSTPTYSAGNYSYCVGNAGQMSLITSQNMVVYQLVNSSGVAVGPASIGTGSGITLYTNALAADLMNVYVKAYKIGYSLCSATATTVVNFTPPGPTPEVTFSSTALTVQKETSPVNLNLPYSAKSTSPVADSYSIDYSVSANSEGFLDVPTQTSIPSAPGNIALTVPANPATGTYSGTLKIYQPLGAGCNRSYGFTITVYAAGSPPVISVQPSNVSICSGTTTPLSVTATGSGTLSYQWKSATSWDGTYTNVGTDSPAYTTASLTATTYFRVMVSNANGSVTSSPTTVTVNPSPVATGSVTGTATVCAGQTVTYSISAISNATSYTWAYSGTNTTITPGSNSVSLAFSSTATGGALTVNGNNACGSGNVLTKTITVNPTPYINNLTKNACNGVAFTVTPTGTIPFGTTYSWSAPVVTGSITGGATGSGSVSIGGTLTNPGGTIQTATYTVTPTAGTCAGSTFTVIVSLNPPISLAATPDGVNCNGGTTGGVNLVVSGGTPPYTYAWTGPGFTATTQNLSGLAAGTYNLIVTDSKGCTATTSAVVTQPASISITPTITNVTCNAGTTGAVSIAVSGGNSPYTYLWNDGSASQNRSGLTAGTYSVTVTDANGCTVTSSGNAVTQPTAISASVATSAILCSGGTSTLTVTASGGTGTLTYSINGGTYQSGNTFGSIAASASPYIITVKDASNCTTTANVTVSQPAVLSLSTVVTHASCPGVSDGAINLSVSGGTIGSGYTYAWGGGITTEDRIALPAGSYSVTVTDANLCTATTSVTITNTNASPAVPGTIRK